jgi:hypothetical protein
MIEARCLMHYGSGIYPPVSTPRTPPITRTHSPLADTYRLAYQHFLSDGKLGADLRCFGILRGFDRYQARFKWDRRILSTKQKIQVTVIIMQMWNVLMDVCNRRMWTEGVWRNLYRTLVPIACCIDVKGSATCSQGIRGYVSVLATLKFTLYK